MREPLQETLVTECIPFHFNVVIRTLESCFYTDSHQREKRLLLDEVVQLKKEKELLERDNGRKDSQILQAREELDKSATALRSAETKIQMLRNQVHRLM